MLQHGPANCSLRLAPLDTVETMLSYHVWHLDCLKETIRDAIFPVIVDVLDNISGVVEAEWRAVSDES